MRVKTVHRKALNYKRYIKRRAQVADCGEEIRDPCAVFDQEGNLLCIYDMLEADTDGLAEDLGQVKYTETTRTNGLVTRSRIFGYQPRLERRQRPFCNHTTLANDAPRVEGKLRGLADLLTEKYFATAPDTAAKHMEMTDKVLDEWRMGESLFTSGIINKNNALAYHFDAGNFENVLSCMLVLRKDMDGGWLCVPEINIRFFLRNNALFLFDGQRILHGVTPMEATSEQAYRFSVVYYSLRGMWKCMTMTEELARARQLELERLKK